MTIKIRKYKGRKDVLEVDIVVRMPNGETVRERRKAPVSSRSGAMRWAAEREREILTRGITPKLRADVSTIIEFKPRFIDGYARANKHKDSGIESKEYALRAYIVPLLGHKRLDAITNEDVAALKSKLTAKATSTTNNVLSTLNVMLKTAVEWKVIDAMPCRIKLLKMQKATMSFYEPSDYARYVDAARRADPRIELIVLLGGDAGLRRGEILGLEQADVDLKRNLLTVARSIWRGKATPTKGMEYRHVPLTKRLAAALAANRHLRGPRVLYADDGAPLTAKILQRWLLRAQKLAGIRATGAVHVLRHSFCSHLAMRGAPALSIQKLAGHKNLETTLRYLHLAEGEAERAIRLLETAAGRGDILETSTTARTGTDGSGNDHN
ncbi:MAG: site-specific integrase [Sandaracinus sp.]